MKVTELSILAAIVALAMALLIRSGVTPSLRAAIRTTAVVVLGWILGYSAAPPNSIANLPFRVWVMLALSVLAIGVAWWLHYREPQVAESAGPALADRINVFFAAAFALILFLGPAADHHRLDGLLLIVGAFILTRSRS
jgi:uncharacterized membrane protein